MASRFAMASGLTLLFPFLVVILLQGGVEVSAKVTCNVNGHSPLSKDAKNCVNNLIAKGNTSCCQNNCAGPNACTNLCSSGTAATDLCGNCNACAPCQQAGNALSRIIKTCDPDGQGTVGGRNYEFSNPTLYVDVYHT